jgi:hypothetical protein
MEISDDHIVALIQGQAATAQAVTDLKSSVEKGFTFIHNEHQELEKTVGKVSARSRPRKARKKIDLRFGRLPVRLGKRLRAECLKKRRVVGQFGV